MGKALLCGMIFDTLSNFVSWFKEDSCMMLQPVSCHNHQTNLELSRGWLFWVCIFFLFLLLLLFFFFGWMEKFLLRRELRNNTNIFQNYIQKIQRSWAWAKETKNAIQQLWSTGAFLDSGAGAGACAGLGNFWKSRVWVRRLKNY